MTLAAPLQAGRQGQHGISQRIGTIDGEFTFQVASTTAHTAGLYTVTHTHGHR